jgi:hypothetical protein
MGLQTFYNWLIHFNIFTVIFFHLFYILNIKKPVQFQYTLLMKQTVITLRNLIAGNSYMSCWFRVAHKTVTKVVRELCQVIYDHCHKEHSNFPKTEEEVVCDGVFIIAIELPSLLWQN